MINAGIPNQWFSKDKLNSPCNKYRIERPSPHPGHQLKPRLSKGHKLECEDPEAVNAKNKIALIQIINSNGKLNINR
jgi:hypothetical protein